MRRVVITGLGLVSPIGNTVASSWQALLEGKSGISTYLNDPIFKNTQPLNVALVKDFDHSKYKVPHASSRLSSFLHCAVEQALNNNNHPINIEQIDKNRAGICLGTLSSSQSKLLEMISESQQQHFKSVNRLSMLQILTNIPVATLNVKYQFKGPSLTVSTACASGLSAIIEGMKWIKNGEADFVIAGGTEDVYNPLYLNSSLRLQAMSSKVYEHPQHSCRPFDKERSGFILGEGSGIVILESEDHALKRKANILAEISGYGYTSDGFHLVRPETGGDGQIRSMKQAIAMSKVQLSDIDHINVHATSTPAGDEIQAKSIKSLFENTTKKPSISAIKSAIGHTFASAGVIQSIFGILSIRDGIAPKILNLQHPDVEGLNYAKENIKQQINVVLKNAFGFGGINVSAIFKKYQP